MKTELDLKPLVIKKEPEYFDIDEQDQVKLIFLMILFINVVATAPQAMSEYMVWVAAEHIADITPLFSLYPAFLHFIEQHGLEPQKLLQYQLYFNLALLVYMYANFDSARKQKVAAIEAQIAAQTGQEE